METSELQGVELGAGVRAQPKKLVGEEVCFATARSSR